MSKIDPEMLDQIGSASGIEYKKDNHGNILAVKGPWLPDWFDNYTECLRENQNARRIQLLQKAGKNPNGQTKEVAKAFEDRKKIQLIRKERAETALLASQKFEGGN
jgi:hypothetical protein